MTTSFERRRVELGDRLRQLREQAGLNAKQLATDIGWNAPKLSKLENGKQTGSHADLTAWLAALRVDRAVAVELRALLGAVHEDYVTWKQELRAGHQALQEQALDLEANASLIRTVDVGIVPGLLQTPEYARHILTAAANMHGDVGDDITEAVRTRMRRQQILFEPGKTIEMLVTESALTQPVAPPEVMAGQIHRLVAAIGTPNVRVGILSSHRQLPYMLIHGWWIVDQLVMVETVTREVRITDPDEVDTYSQLTDWLWSVAVEGDEARGVLTRLANQAG